MCKSDYCCVVNSRLPCSWNSYKINQQQDKIGVFVSIVSTKIPFKGTGKEYIGDDISEIAAAVKVTIYKLSSLSFLHECKIDSHMLCTTP